ncbi:MAG: hypothetical protein PUK22_04810 [Bacteroides sp.]|nr:hypothetical protein [Bacteroides sp.]
MKRNEVNGIINFLDRVPVSKIKQKPIRTRLTIAVFTLQKESREINSGISDLRDTIIKGKEDRMKQFSEAAQNYNLAKTVAEKEQLLSRLNREFPEEQKLNEQINDSINAYLEEDASCTIKPFDLEEFMEVMSSVGIEVTGRELRAIEPILKLSEPDTTSSEKDKGKKK